MLKHKWVKTVLLLVFSGSLWATTASTFVFNAQNTPDIVRAVDFARNNQKALIIQGEGTVVPANEGVVYLNLHDFKQMITLQLKQQTMLVQSGMTWNQAQQLVAPFGLSLKFIPAQANESIVATINHNQSGLSPQNALVADGVVSLQLLQSDGHIVNVSHSQTPELWRGVFGAQGTLGVVLGVNLKLVKNQNLVRHAESMSYSDYATYIQEQVQNNPDITANVARLDVVPGQDFLRDIYVVNYWVKDAKPAEAPQLHAVRNHIAHSVYEWSEKGDWEKNVRWQMEKMLLGSDVLHTELTRANLLMRQPLAMDNPIRQVYYIPVAQFVSFIDDLRTVATEQKWPLNQVSVRYIQNPNDLLLVPQQGELFAIAISFSKNSVAEQKIVAPVLADLALSHGGSFTLDQFTAQDIAKIKHAYPGFVEFEQLKAQYDQHNLFVSGLSPAVNA